MAKHEKAHEHKEDEEEHKPAAAEETPDEAAVEEPEADAEEKTEEPKESKEKTKASGNSFKRSWLWACANKKVSIPLAILIVLGLLVLIPFTRYAIGGLFITQDYKIVVLDSQSNKPVTAADVYLKGVTGKTDNEGKATLKVPIGYGELAITKKYYKDTRRDVTVTVKDQEPLLIEAEATGRPVEITVVNSISGAAVENAVIEAEGAEAKTDEQGLATIVVPIDKAELAGTVEGEGYNKVDVTIKSTLEPDPANTFRITPSGKIYFLSNASGKIDMVKSNLDGTERQVVLAGTGTEDRSNTVLLASRDWKYIALLSKRDGGEYAKLFLVETGSDAVTTMDEGEANFVVGGWSGDKFIYTVDRVKVKEWEPKKQALKSYDASDKKITVLDQTAGEGYADSYAREYFSNPYVLGEGVVYGKSWIIGSNSYYYGGYQNAQARLQGKKATFNSINPDGTDKKALKGYDGPSGVSSYQISLSPADYGEIYIQYYVQDYHYDEYKDGKVSTTKLTNDDVYNSGNYSTFVISPSGKKQLRTDYRDGKNAFYVTEGGETTHELGSSEDYTSYGWFTDEYVLVTRKNSEMHIMPATGLPNGGVEASLKVTDYYKPNYYNRGFGYGYGG